MPAPLSPAARDIERIQEARIDYLPGLSSHAKKDRLSRLSYHDFLLHIVQAHPDVIPFYQARTHGLYGVGIDAVPASIAGGLGYPASRASVSSRARHEPHRGGCVHKREPYHFHFPDGNASFARLLVRALVPEAVPGHTVEDIVTTRINYARLDRPGAAVRIRLAVSQYERGRWAIPVITRGRGVLRESAAGVCCPWTRCILACWNMIIPSLCPELPEQRKRRWCTARRCPSSIPTSHSNWTAFHQLGVRTIAAPSCFHHTVSLHEPINIGTYRYARTPEAPVLLRLVRTPCQPGLPAREQHRLGRLELLTTPFATFERHIRDELGRMLAPAGFDPGRDIVAITVNRWPHGYAYEYNPCGTVGPEDEPCVRARQPFGRITIANSDAAAYAYTDAAIDQGYRAVQELCMT